MATDQTLWGIHGGKTGDADKIFLTEDVIALGWDGVGDLSALPADREPYKAAVLEAYPDAKAGAIPVYAGQLFRFVHELQVGDLAVYPSKRDKQVHVGRVKSGYFHASDPGSSYRHRRSVDWLIAVPRTQFSQGALYEIGSAMTFFQVRNYADEFLAAAEGDVVRDVPDDNEAAAVVAQDIEQQTRDFVLKKLAKELKGHPFAHFVAHLLNAMGYRTRVSPEGPDAGIDIVAHRDELGLEPPIIKVQVKSTEGSVGDPIVSQLYGKVADNEHGLLVTLGVFTPQAKNFERSKSNLRLIGGEELVDLILEHYDSFDSRYKGLLPLKRVFIPEPLEEV